MVLTVNGTEKYFKDSLSLEQIAKEFNIKEAIAASVGGRIRELTYLINDDANIEFLGLDIHEGMRIYEATLRYVFAMALFNLNPKLKLRFSYSVSRAILVTIDNAPFTNELYNQLIDEVNNIVKLALPIRRLSVSKEEATKIYQKYGYLDKIDTLKHRVEDNVNLYQTGNYV